MSSKDIRLGVSSYSYQEAIWRGDLDLEGVITAIKGCGGEGIEIFGEELIPSFPHVSDEFLYKWKYLTENIGVEPVCYEHFADRRYWKKELNKYLTDDDLFDVTMQYLRSAKKLGCPFIKLSHDGHNGRWIMNDEYDHTIVNARVFERLLPYAEEMGVKMAMEVHAPGLLEDGGNEDFLEAIERTKCYNAAGLMLDLSGVYRDTNPMQEDSYVKMGAKREIVQYLREMSRKAYTCDENGEFPEFDWDEVEAKVKEMGGGKVELMILNGMGAGGHNSIRHRLITPMKTVKEYASKLVYIHGKMHWINEDCTSDETDYHGLFKALCEGGYKGWICTEFEGQRSVPHTLNEVEFVRRQHVLMRECLAECEAAGL